VATDRVERLCTLVMCLLGWDRLTRAQIAERVPGYPTNPESMRAQLIRDKETLAEEGVDVHAESQPDGTWVYWIDPEEFYLPELDLTAQEEVALAAAAVAVEPGNGTLRDALLQLGGVVTDGAVPLRTVLPEMGVLDAMFDAQVRRGPVMFSYKGKERAVEPWALLSQRGWWYLVGFERGAGAQRSFRVDRVEGPVTIGTPGSVVVPAGFEARTAIPAPWQLPVGESVEAVVDVDPAMAAVAVGEVGEDAVVERFGNGSVRLRFAVTHRPAFRAWVLGLLDHAEVVGPPSLRAEIVEWLEAMAGAER